MTAGRKIIFVEFNELCPDLLKDWMAAGKLPHFKRFYEASQVFTGLADVTDPEYLEPWIQWYSLHTGLTYDQHQVFHLTDGPRAGHDDIWHALLAGGRSVGNFAGMNAPAFATPGSFYVPDPWCATEAPYPSELAAYQRVVLAKVQENTNKTAPLGGRDYLEFLRFLAGNGLRGRSLLAIASQLAADMVQKESSWKRAALLDKLQMDVFLHYWQRTKPDFASFFCNSTAHFQHAYFHLLKPDAFDLPAADLQDPVHKDAVLFGYQQMDQLLADLMALESQGVMLVLATALSQQPNPKAGNKYYRPRNIDALLKLVNVAPARLLPVMAQQYSAEFSDAAAAAEARARLDTLTIAGRPLFAFNDSPENTLFFGNELRREVAPDETFLIGNTSHKYYDHFYKIPHTKSGIHHPDSVLWFKTGTHRVHAGKMPIINIFPTLLAYFGVTAPGRDGIARQGESFLPLLDVPGYGAAARDYPVAAE